MMKLDYSFEDEYVHLTDNAIFEYSNGHELNEPKWVKILLSSIHDDLYWIGEVPIHITADLIHKMNGLPKTGPVLPTGKNVKKKVEQVCLSRSDRHRMTIDSIKADFIKLVTMILGYKY